MVKKNRRSRRSTAAAAPAATHQNPDDLYKAPTPGLKDVVFTEGSAQDAARFEENLRTLASYVGTQSWSQSSEIAKAMVELQAPVHDELEKPTRMYYVYKTLEEPVPVPAQTKEKYHADETTKNVPVVDDYEYKEERHIFGCIIRMILFLRLRRNWFRFSRRFVDIILASRFLRFNMYRSSKLHHCFHNLRRLRPRLSTYIACQCS